jgi:hypothetical protein
VVLFCGAWNTFQKHVPLFFLTVYRQGLIINNKWEDGDQN